MTKEELIQLLKEYRENKARLNIKLKERCRIVKNRQRINKEDFETSLTSAYGQNQDIHSKNKISDKVYQKVEQLDNKKREAEEELEELEAEINILKSKVDEVEYRLDGLYPKERELLSAYYIDNMTYEEIGNRKYWELYNQTRDTDTIRKIIKKALKKMVNI